MKTNHSRMTFISTVTALATVLALLTFFTATDPVLGQEATNVTEGKITYRPVVKNGRILWFEGLEANETIGRVSLSVYENGNSRLITNDASVLFPGWPDMDDAGNVAYVKNMGRSHEVFVHDGTKETQITNNVAIKNSRIAMALGGAKVYVGYVRIHDGNVVFRDQAGHIYLYDRRAKGIRKITSLDAHTANLGDEDKDDSDEKRVSTGLALPLAAHVKYYEYDGHHIVWMHEDRVSNNNSKVSIYMASASLTPANHYKVREIAAFDAWVPNNKAVVPGKVWNPFFRACDGRIIWQYYLPSQPPKLPAGVPLPNLLKDYGADMENVQVGFYDGTQPARVISSGTAVHFQSVRILNGLAVWSQIRKEGKGKDVKEFTEIKSGSGTIASYPERPKQAALGKKFWDRILDVEISGDDAFWVMDQSECFQHFKMPVTNEPYCMYKPTGQVGFFHQRTGKLRPFKQLKSTDFGGGGELDRGLYAFFRHDTPITRDIAAVNVAGGGDGQSDNFITVADLKQPDTKKLRADEKGNKHVSDAFSINFDLLPGCGGAEALLDEITAESITLDVSAEKSPTARLEDIKSVALYSDENQDRKLDAGDKLLGSRNGPVPAETIFTFSGNGIKIERKKPRHFLVEMELVDEVCPCGKYTVEVSGAKLGIKNQPGLGAVSAGGKTTGSLILPEAEIKQIRGDEQAGLPNQKLPDNLAVVFENFPVRCGKVKFKITTQPLEKGAIIFSSSGETTDEVILDLSQVGKDATAEIGFQLGKEDGLYTIRASIEMAGGVECNNKDHIFREHAGRMVVQPIDLNNPDYFSATSYYPNSDYSTWKATMSSDIEKLSLGGEGREGMLADGASMLLLRMKLVGFKEPPAGDINVSISGTGNIGHLTKGLGEAIPSYDGSSSLSVKWLKTRTGVFGFALYTPPKNYGYSPTPRRNVHLKVTYALAGAPEPLVNEQNLTLQKPSIAFIHGLWSDAETWGIPFTRHTSQYEVHFLDYSARSSMSFAELGAELQIGIRDIVGRLRQRKIAATRINVVGHSMGGLIARQFFADDQGKDFFRKDNFGQGDIYKLITLGTPHYGSPLAWLLVGLRDLPLSPVAIEARKWKIDVEGGAVDALCPGSIDLQRLGTTYIPTHTVRAWNFDSRTQALTWDQFVEGLRDELEDLIRDPKSVRKASPAGFMLEVLKHSGEMTGGVLLSSLYGADRTDMLVTLESQGGGIAQGANNVFPGTIHFDTGYDLRPELRSETTSELIAVHIFDTLNRDYDDINYFAPKLPPPIVADPRKSCRGNR